MLKQIIDKISISMCFKEIEFLISSLHKQIYCTYTFIKILKEIKKEIVRLNEHEFEQTLGYGEAQGSLSCRVHGVFQSQRVRHNLVTE